MRHRDAAEVPRPGAAPLRLVWEMRLIAAIAAGKFTVALWAGTEANK